MTPAARCPSDDALVGHVRERPDAAIEAHLDSCSLCRRTAALVAREATAPSDNHSQALTMLSDREVEAAATAAPTTLHAGARIGRFALIDAIGAGGMAEVWAAYDPVLDRRVAIKLLLPRVSSDQTFLIREARAVARLAHPNVVAVHDAGDVGGRVFIAMEYLAGGDLRRYLATEKRSWPDIIARFCEAGRGLAAAHAAGLVHRDFKAANVLLAADGRVVVADFGLAGARSSDAGQSLGETIAGDAPIGTPAYMAPEQHRGEPCDASSDQFSFAVSLWQALYGELPYAGDTPQTIRASVLAGKRRDAPAGSSVPGRIRRALERALAYEPTGRWGSIDELMTALDPAPRRRRRYVAAGAVLLAVTVGAAAFAGGRQADPCRGDDARWASALGPDWSARGQRAFAATGVAYAGSAWDLTRRGLDAYGTRWRDMYRTACQAGQRGEHSAALLDARMRCLDASLGAASSLVARLAHVDRAAVQRAVDAANGLPSVAACADVAALAAQPPPPPEQRAAVTALDRRVADLDAQRRLDGRGDPAAVDAALDDARKLGYAPTLAAAAAVVAVVADAREDLPRMERAIDESLASAYVGHDDNTLARVAALRAWNLSRRDSKYDEARHWGALARAATERSDGDLRLRANVLKTLGRIELDAGDVPAAMPLLQRALAIAETSLGPDHATTGLIAGELADAFRVQGDTDRAEAWATRELDTLRHALGEQHPLVGYAWFNEAMAAWDEGNRDVAALRFRRAVGIFDDSLGPDHPDRLRAVAYLAEMLATTGHADETLALTAALRPRLPAIAPALRADILQAEAAAINRSGRPGDAMPVATAALAAAVEALGTDSADVLPYLLELLHATAASGRDASALYQRGVALAATAPEPEAQRIACDEVYGQALVEGGHPEAAIELLTQALATREKGSRWRDAAEDRLALAEALWRTDRDRPRARALLDASAGVARERDAGDLAAAGAALRVKLGVDAAPR